MLALLAGCLATLSLVSGAALAAPLPPDLVSLEQQMAQLQVHSERFSMQLEIALAIGGPNSPLVSEGGPQAPSSGPSVPLVLFLAGEGEASDSPREGSVNVSFEGQPTHQVRIVGATDYAFRPAVAHSDGGRPWVSSPDRSSAEKANPLEPSSALGGMQGGPQGTFSNLVEELNRAQSVVESGPVTVDDQRVTEFDATLDPTVLLEQLQARAKHSKHPLQSPFEVPPTGAEKPAKPAPPPKLTLELFIAPNGLPVRSRITIAMGHTLVALRVDTLATNIPVNVVAPPAAQVISEAQLQRIERRRARRERRAMLRSCRRSLGRRSSVCRRLARRPPPSSGEGSESSLL